jgi:predicted nucleic acid-binding protein
MDTLTVLDTDVFIDHFRGLAAATAYIQGLRVAQRATTDMTVMEPVSAAASQRAVTLLHDYSLAHGLAIPDALIAAIALEGDHTLVTSNLAIFGLSRAYAWDRRRTGFLNLILPRSTLAHGYTA